MLSALCMCACTKDFQGYNRGTDAPLEPWHLGPYIPIGVDNMHRAGHSTFPCGGPNSSEATTSGR